MLRVFVVLAVLGSTTAIAQEQPVYLDDRSTPEAVIQSYYNAINRSEYARAYSYFGKDEAPESYDTWEVGYSDTHRVDVTTGTAMEEGAAGSIFYSVPVLLIVESTEEQHSLFNGCYQLRLAQPAIQGVPFEPMHIESAKLQQTDGEELGVCN